MSKGTKEHIEERNAVSLLGQKLVVQVWGGLPLAQLGP